MMDRDVMEEGKICEWCGYQEVIIFEGDTGGVVEEKDNPVEEVELYVQDEDETEDILVCLECRLKAGLAS